MPPSLEECVALIQRVLATDVAWEHAGAALDALEEVERVRQWASLASTDLFSHSKHLLHQALPEDNWLSLKRIKNKKRRARLRTKYWSVAVGWRRYHITDALLQEDADEALQLEARYLGDSVLLDNASADELVMVQSVRDHFERSLRDLLERDLSRIDKSTDSDSSSKSKKKQNAIQRMRANLNAWKRTCPLPELQQMLQDYLSEVQNDYLVLQQIHRKIATCSKKANPAQHVDDDPAQADAGQTQAPANHVLRVGISPAEAGGPQPADVDLFNTQPAAATDSATQSTLEYVDPSPAPLIQQEEKQGLAEVQANGIEPKAAPPQNPLQASEAIDVEMAEAAPHGGIPRAKDEPIQNSPVPMQVDDNEPPNKSEQQPPSSGHAEPNNPSQEPVGHPGSNQRCPPVQPRHGPLVPFPSPDRPISMASFRQSPSTTIAPHPFRADRHILVPNSQPDETQHTIDMPSLLGPDDAAAGPDRSTDLSSGARNANASESSSFPENQLGLFKKPSEAALSQLKEVEAPRDAEPGPPAAPEPTAARPPVSALQLFLQQQEGQLPIPVEEWLVHMRQTTQPVTLDLLLAIKDSGGQVPDVTLMHYGWRPEVPNGGQVKGAPRIQPLAELASLEDSPLPLVDFDDAQDSMERGLGMWV